MIKSLRSFLLSLLIAGALIPVSVYAARTQVDWVNLSGTSYIQPNFGLNGMDLLIVGSNHYINFNAVTGLNGYGIRDNGGIIECKNSGGSWSACQSGGSGGGSGLGTTSALSLLVATYPILLSTTTSSATFSFPATSTLFGTCTAGQVIGWTNGILACVSTSSSAWPFTPSSYAGVANQSTTTNLYLKTASIIASSTFFTQASTTQFTNTGSEWLTNTTNGLLKTDVNGLIGIQASSTLFDTGTGGQFLVWANGIPKWTASTTYSAPLVFSAGNVTCSTCFTGSVIGTSTNPLMATYLVATSTLTASQFPYASTTALTVSGIAFPGRTQSGSGSQSLPAYAFSNDTDTGFYNSTGGVIRVVLDGVVTTTWNSAEILMDSSDDIRSQNPAGYRLEGLTPSLSNPTYAFSFDNDTGMWNGSTGGMLKLITDGTSVFETSSASTTVLTGNFGISTTSPGSILSIGSVANFTTATSTFYSTGGINLAAGCFSVNGVCVTSSSAPASLGYVAWGGSIATTFGTTTIASTTPPWFMTGLFASSTSQFANASTTALTVSGNEWLTSLTNALLSTDSLGKIVATTTPTALNYIATSATATSTLQGSLTVGAGMTFPYLDVGTTSAIYGYLPQVGLNVHTQGTNDFFGIASYNGGSGNCTTATFDALNNLSDTGSDFNEFGETGPNFTGRNPNGSPCALTNYPGFAADSGYIYNISTDENIAANRDILFFTNTGIGTVPTSSLMFSLRANGSAGLGTSTPKFGELTIGTSTAPQLVLTDNNPTNPLWAFRASGSSLTIASSTFSATTSSSNLFVLGQNGALCVGMGCTAPTASGIFIRDQDGTGPALFMGGNDSGDTDWKFMRAANNNVASDDPLTLGTVSTQSSTPSPFLVFQSSGAISMSTSTPKMGVLTIGSTSPQLILTDNNPASPLWAFRAISNSFFISTSTSNATSSQSIFQLNSLVTAGYDLVEFWSATSTGPLFGIDQYGHVFASSTTPIISSCGTTPSLTSDSSDFAGTITVGSVAATACTLTFGTAHTTGTHCVISEQTGSVVNVASYTEGLTGFTYSQTGLTSDKLDYICTGK